MYRREIDGLRALAVLAVILNHFEKSLLPGGYLGVDIFFVISGYVITASLFQRPTVGLGALLGGFYTRRVKRLVPALVTFVLIGGLLICLFDPSPSVTLKTGVASLFGVSNLYLARQATDYFGALAQMNVFTHTWSLGVEEQFYVFFPFIVWLTAFGRHNESRAWVFYAVMGVLTLLSLASFVHLTNTAPTTAYYFMPARFWELAAGAFAFRLMQRVPSPLVAGPYDSGLSAIVLLALSAGLVAPDTHGSVTTFAVVALTVGLIRFTLPGTIVFRLFTSKALVYIGLISYSLYLWHWVVLTLSRWTIGLHWWSAPFQFALMLLLASASYRFVEKPLRHATWSRFKWGTIGLGVGAMTLTMALLGSLILPFDGRLYLGERPQMLAIGTASLTDPHTVGNTVWSGPPCVLSSNLDVDKILSYEQCTLGHYDTAKTRVLVIGNSFSTAFTHAFDTLVTQDEFAVTITSSWGASPVGELPNSTPWAAANSYYWGAAVPKLISQLKAGDVVFMMSDMIRFSPEQHSAGTDEELALLRQGLTRMSKALSKQDIRLVVLHGNPFAREANCDPATVLEQWFAPFGGRCKFLSKTSSLQRRAALDNVLKSLEATKIIQIVDLFDVFCQEAVCHYRAKDGRFLYRDAWSHPSIEGAQLSAPVIRKVLHLEVARASVNQTGSN